MVETTRSRYAVSSLSVKTPLDVGAVVEKMLGGGDGAGGAQEGQGRAHSDTDSSIGVARGGRGGKTPAPGGNSKTSSVAPSTPELTSAGMSSSASTIAASSRLIRVPGCLGTKSVQQSASGSMEISKV